MMSFIYNQERNIMCFNYGHICDLINLLVHLYSISDMVGYLWCDNIWRSYVMYFLFLKADTVPARVMHIDLFV